MKMRTVSAKKAIILAVVIALIGAYVYFGIKIYPESSNRPSRYFRYGNRELLPGRWYHDYNYVGWGDERLSPRCKQKNAKQSQSPALGRKL